MESFNLIDIQSLTDDTDKLGRLHRQLILVQISEATAVRKLQQSQSKCKKLEAQLIRTEQKHDRDQLEFYTVKREYISKIGYLRSTVQDLRHKYAGSIPLKQQERLAAAKIQVAEMKKELVEKLSRVSDEKYELEDKIAEYELKLKDIELLKNAAIHSKDGAVVKFNQKFLDVFKKNESIKMINLKLDRTNKRLRDEIKFVQEMNRKHEIAIIALEEENLRMESDYDSKIIIWEHREADLERAIEHLRKQHDAIESLAINFEEISGHMPDPNLPVSGQLDQAMDIIRSHIKLLAEAKVQADLSKKRIQDLETHNRKLESEVTIRDKVITELRLRLPASSDRDAIIKSMMASSTSSGGEMSTNNAPVKAAQATIESLQHRLKQKDETIVKYQDMLKLARDEITNINKQHEIEINNLIDKLNLTRDTNIEKLRQELQLSSGNGQAYLNKAQLSKLQELEEVTVEQDNVINGLNQKIRKLNTEIDTWKTRHELLTQQSAQDIAKIRKEELEKVEKLKKEMADYRDKIGAKESEISRANDDLERHKQEASKSPSQEMKSLVEKLKTQLAEKEEQHRKLNQALNNMKGEMVELAKNNLTSLGEEQSQERRIREIAEKVSGEYQDKIMKVSEELAEVKKQLRQTTKSNEELKLEIEHAKSQLKSKDAKLKKLSDENKKLTDDKKSPTRGQSLTVESKPSEVDELKRQIRVLEERLRRQRQSIPEKPYSDSNKSRSKSPKAQDDSFGEASSGSGSLKYQLEQYKTRYNYVLSENAILKREKYDLEVEIERMKRDLDVNGVKVFNENKILREELERLRSRSGVKGRTFSPSNNSKSPDLRAENKSQLLLELKKLTEENTRLREKAANVDVLKRNIELLKSRNERYENDDAQSTGSTSSVRKIGESGKSAVELEKTIALMKKIILKLQAENENLKKK